MIKWALNKLGFVSKHELDKIQKERDVLRSKLHSVCIYPDSIESMEIKSEIQMSHQYYKMFLFGSI